MHSLPHYQYSAPEWHICCSQGAYIDWHIIIQSPQFTLGFTLGFAHSVGWNKCIMTRIYHYSILQTCFTALKVLCALPIYFSPPNCWQPMIFLLPFPERHIVGIIQYASFQTGFFHLLICIGISFMSFHGLIAHFFLVLNNILVMFPWIIVLLIPAGLSSLYVFTLHIAD